MSDDLEKNESINVPEKNPEINSEDFEDKTELDPNAEKIGSELEKDVVDKLRKEIELMEIDGATKEELEKKAKKIEFLGEREKIEHLLVVAKEKGVIFAVKMAMEMKDPNLLDNFHDILAKGGFYKNLNLSR